MAPEAGRVQISFPRHAAALLDSLNRLRLEGKFCDVAVHVGGRVFPAHKSVLAAASPFFHDKLVLQDGGRLALPPAIDAGAFEGLLTLIYCGRLTVAVEALPGHLLVASGLQMWHVVDRCSQILREVEGGAGRWGARSAEGSSCVDHGEGLSSVWVVHDGDGAIRGHDGSLSSSSSSRVVRGHDGSLSSSWNVHGEDEAIHGLDGSSHGLEGSIHRLDGSSHTNHGHDGSSSSSSSRANHGHKGSSSLSSRATHGYDGCSLSSSRTIRGPDGSSRVSRSRDVSSHVIHGGDGPSSSSSSSPSWILCGVDAASRLNRGEGPSSSFSWRSHGGEGTIHGDIEPIHGDDGPSSSSSSSWATSTTKAITEEVLQIRMAAGTSPVPPKTPDGEILKICVEEDEEDDDDDDEGPSGTGALRIVLEDAEDEAAAPRDPPKIFYVKQESGEADTAAIETLLPVMDLPPASADPMPPNASLFPQPAWKPVDLHGNEISGRGGGLHAPVKLGATPADGKRFGCACGKRFAVKPKRDRHIMLTLSLRPFACATCHKRFKLKHHLTEHMKTHDGARGACQGCGRRFRLRSGLAKHRPLCPGGRWGGGCWACE